jgi:hypothetical protein
MYKNNLTYKYHLSDNRQVKKGTCPQCRKPKCFVYYLDSNNNKAGDQYGKCDRADKCGYICYPPSEPKEQQPYKQGRQTSPPPPPPPPPSFIDIKTVQATQKRFDKNTFFCYLSGVCGKETTQAAFNRYNVGTTKDGATIFWQIDTNGNARSGKIMHYLPNGHRDHARPPTWVHRFLKLDGFNLKQCLFGLHLLPDTTKKLAIVESEKTAIVASIYLPAYFWLATGGLQNLKADLFHELKNFDIVLFPDLKARDKWNEKAKELRRICRSVTVSDLLEKRATEQEREKGLDLADYLLKSPPETQTTTPKQQTEPPQPPTLAETPQITISQPKQPIEPPEIKPPKNAQKPPILANEKKSIKTPTKTAFNPENWNTEISDFEKWLLTATLPAAPFHLNRCTVINDIPLFIDVSIETAKAHNGNPTYRPYFDRLLEFKKLVSYENRN